MPIPGAKGSPQGHPLAQDIAQFSGGPWSNLLQRPLNTEHVIRSARDVDIAHQVNIDPQNQGIGDQILNNMQQYGSHVEMQEATINALVNPQNDEPLSVQDMLRLQVAVLVMGHERDIITKAVDKTSQGVQTLLRNQ